MVNELEEEVVYVPCVNDEPHYFIVPSPKLGIKTLGKCKVCGTERQMSNVQEAPAWPKQGRGRPKKKE